MSANWGKNIELSLFGESHGKAIGIVIGNLPAGIKLDLEAIKKDLSRRAPGKNKMSTARKEKDEVEIISGVIDGVTTGAPLVGMIYNSDQHSKDYSYLKELMRPGHSDYSAYEKYHGFNDVRGGGHFSGRLTAPIVFAGAIAKQILKQQGIYVGAHIQSIKDVYDESFSVNISEEMLENLLLKQYPTINDEVFTKMQETIEEARLNQNSVGGTIECAIINVPAGIGNPFFDSVEAHLSQLLFSIPAVKSVSFGLGEKITELYGSEANDSYYYDGDIVKTKTNNNGGILGGISNGMPIVFKVGIKPTPSVSLKQDTINVKTKENSTLEIKGRHDPCIVPRAIVVVEAMAALGILDMIGYQ
ncbi:MAG: chorismate synthase [Bacilli bacterium]|nr:chorismate synthase [Bacilli bacterium]